jgi:hypothetical protein
VKSLRHGERICPLEGERELAGGDSERSGQHWALATLGWQRGGGAAGRAGPGGNAGQVVLWERAGVVLRDAGSP